jgi:hypothetical protein
LCHLQAGASRERAGRCRFPVFYAGTALEFLQPSGRTIGIRGLRARVGEGAIEFDIGNDPAAMELLCPQCHSACQLCAGAGLVALRLRLLQLFHGGAVLHSRQGGLSLAEIGPGQLDTVALGGIVENSEHLPFMHRVTVFHKNLRDPAGLLGGKIHLRVPWLDNSWCHYDVRTSWLLGFHFAALSGNPRVARDSRTAMQAAAHQRSHESDYCQ